MPHRPKVTHVLLAAVLMAMLITPFAVAQSGDDTGGARIERSDDRYAFLARNTLNGDGGAGALACQSDANPAGQTNREPCLNMVNKGTGYAAAFRTRGLTGFRLQTSGTGQATPFLLDSNATGKVEHLNSDTVDGLSADQMRARYARVTFTAPDQVASPEAQRNGVTSIARTGAGRYVVTFDRDITNCALHVTQSDPAAARTTAVAPLAGNNNAADVAIRKADEPNEGDLVDSSFYISANC